MKNIKLTNNHIAALGLPSARPTLIIDAKASQTLPEDHFNDLMKNKTVKGWLDTGILSVDGADEADADDDSLADAETGDDSAADANSTAETAVTVEAQGGGWFRVFVGGVEVSEKNMRKDAAEALAAEYA